MKEFRDAIIVSGYIGLQFSDVYTALATEVSWGQAGRQESKQVIAPSPNMAMSEVKKGKLTQRCLWSWGPGSAAGSGISHMSQS